jgi:hypothetical protein
MAVRHSEANWTQALADLREAPAKPQGARSLRQAIQEAIEDVMSCRERGHTDSDIVAIFARNGIQMSLHTFRQYVRRARRAKAEQALGEKRKLGPASKIQTRDMRGDTPTTKGRKAHEASAISAGAPEAQSPETKTAAPTTSPAKGAPISQNVSKPLRQTGKTAAEVLGHRFNEDV